MSPAGEEPPRVLPLPDTDEAVAVAVPVPDPEPTPSALAETAQDIEDIDTASPRVAIVVADREGLLVLDRAEAELERRGIGSEVRVMSADEEPRAVAEYTENAQLRGIRVIVAGAGPAARLPMMITVHTELPVIGVPLSCQGAQTGLEELLHDARPASGAEPVAWVALDDALNAAALAARILGAHG